MAKPKVDKPAKEKAKDEPVVAAPPPPPPPAPAPAPLIPEPEPAAPQVPEVADTTAVWNEAIRAAMAACQTVQTEATTPDPEAAGGPLPNLGTYRNANFVEGADRCRTKIEGLLK